MSEKISLGRRGHGSRFVLVKEEQHAGRPCGNRISLPLRRHPDPWPQGLRQFGQCVWAKEPLAYNSRMYSRRYGLVHSVQCRGGAAVSPRAACRGDGAVRHTPHIQPFSAAREGILDRRTTTRGTSHMKSLSGSFQHGSLQRTHCATWTRRPNAWLSNARRGWQLAADTGAPPGYDGRIEKIHRVLRSCCGTARQETALQPALGVLRRLLHCVAGAKNPRCATACNHSHNDTETSAECTKRYSVEQ